MSGDDTTTDPPVPQTVWFGKYELLERLGRGGMADVWRARFAGPKGFARVVVLKRILPHLIADEKARTLFEREARVVSRLSHAHIVQVFEFGEIDGEYYLAMEYVDGRDVAAMIRAGACSPAAAAIVIRDTSRALAYGFNLRGDDGAPLRILHRDVSPSNIMIGYDGSVRLLDFGIAKALSDPRDKRTVKGTIRGKFGYIAPEIIEGKEPDARADLFSLGVVLHEMLTGKRLFRGGSDLETLALVRRSIIPLPSTLNPNVPAALDEITMRALERDRDRRFASGDQMADALDEVVHGLRFGPAQLGEQMLKFFPRGEAFGDEDSGAHTVNESPGHAAGHGTAKSVDLDPVYEGPTGPTRDMAVATLPPGGKPRENTTAPEKSSVRPLLVGGVPGPDVDDDPDDFAQTIVAVVKKSKVAPASAKAAPTPASSTTGLVYVLMGLLIAVLVIGAALVGRALGRAKRASVQTTTAGVAQPAVYLPTPTAGGDLTTAAVDLTTAAADLATAAADLGATAGLRPTAATP